MSNLASQVLEEKRKNKISAIDMLRFSEQQEEVIRQFAKDGGLEYLVGGGNQGGKSVTVSAIMASVILNKPLTMRNGEKLHMRPERWRKGGIRAWIVGYDHKHCGKTIYRLLFQTDLFRIIYDAKLGDWRSWNPSIPEDADREHETCPSPALIRFSDIEGGEDGISWENKKEHQISSCVMSHDGTEVRFFASTGAKPQGDPVHVIWCDERLDDDQKWYSELLMRLLRYRGRLIWTSWPDTCPSPVLAEMEKRAKDHMGEPKCKSFAYRLAGSKNPYTTGEHRDYALSTMDEDTRRARDEGHLNMDRWRVYPRFSRYVHKALITYDHELSWQEIRDEWNNDPLSAAIRRKNCIPPDWTRYLVFDPGTANPAVLLVAVPPPFIVGPDEKLIKLEEFIVPYDELYPHYSDATRIAKFVSGKTMGQYFEDFIIDSHAARQTPMGFTGTIGQNYSKAFAAENLRCRRHGSMFSYGSDDVDSRIMVLQGMMTIRSTGTPKLRILDCPILCSQLEAYKWGVDPKSNPTDKPDKYQKNDVAICLEYFTSRSDCGYVKPPMSTPDDFRSPKAVVLSIAKSLGLDKDKPKKDESIYCGAGAPHKW